MLWTLGFMTTFAIGGMTGVMMSVPPIDFQVHNSVFLIAHFHNVIIGGVLFGYFAGFIYWFPKAFGFKLDEKLGKYAFWCWIVGFYVAFMPLYALGFMGMTRRLSHYDVLAWQPYLIVAMIGAFIIAAGVLFQILQLVVSIRNREKYKAGNDPWDGRTLEWSIASPAPLYNFAYIPEVHEKDAFWHMKQQGTHLIPRQPDKSIHMPKNTGTGFLIAVFSGIFGFAMVWHIHWLIIVGLLGMIATCAVRTFNMDIDYYLTPGETKTS